MLHPLNTNDPTALQLLLTEDLYLINNKDAKLVEVQTLQDKKSKSIYFDYLGENNAYFLILIEDKNQTQIAPSTLATLLKIMQAKGLSLKDLAIVNFANYPEVTFNELKSFFAPTRLVLFGINPQLLQLPPLAANEPETIHNVKTMASYGLEEMEANQDKKRQFWSIMKNF